MDLKHAENRNSAPVHSCVLYVQTEKETAGYIDVSAGSSQMTETESSQ